MAKTPEGKVKDEIKAYLRLLGDECWFFMPVPGGFGVRGIPDFIGCYRGKFFAIEAKAGTGKTTAFQQAVGEKIVAAGGIWVVAHSAESVFYALQP